MNQKILQLIAIGGFLGCIAGSLVGCTSTSDPRVVSFEKSETRLVLLKDENREDGIQKNRPALLESDEYKNNEKKVIASCATIPAIESSAIPAVLGLLLTSLVNVTFEKIDQSLQDEIKKYSHVSSAARGIPFYKRADGANPERVASEITCLRFVRARKANDTSEITDVDFIAQLRIVNQSWIEIQPLRLYFSNPIAKSSNERFGLAMKLKASTIHRDGSSGARAVVFDDVVLTQKAEVTDAKAFVKYYFDDADRIVRLPLPPYSEPVQNNMTRDFTTFEITLAETGSPNSKLVTFSKVFAGAREDIAKLLAAAANEHLGWSADE